MKTDIAKTGIIILFASILTFPAMAQPQNGGRPPRERPSPEQLMEMMDSNKDNRLSRDEIHGPLARDFDKVDINGDGFITKEELEKAPEPRGRESRLNSLQIRVEANS